MKKVIQIITRLDKGGSAELVLQTCSKLVEQNFEVLLISGKTKNPPFDIDNYVRQNGFKIIYVSQLIRNINPILDIIAFLKLLIILKKQLPDILHTNTSKAGFIGRIAGYFAGIKKIFHSPHGHIFYGYYSKNITKLFILMEKIATKFSTKIFNLTEKGKQDHINQKIGKSDKFAVSSCEVDLSKFKSIQPKELSNEKIKILWIGRFVPIKNPEMVLDVAKNLRNKNIEFRMVGDGECFQNIKDKIKQKNLTNIILPGYQTDLLPELYNADIFIITSKNEGFGRVIVDAMAAGLPVIGTNVGGIPEIITENINGFLVNTNDDKKMAKIISELIDNKNNYSQISKNNLKKSQKYSLDSYVTNITYFYKRN